jgi:hypothetical protein
MIVGAGFWVLGSKFLQSIGFFGLPGFIEFAGLLGFQVLGNKNP